MLDEPTHQGDVGRSGGGRAVSPQLSFTDLPFAHAVAAGGTLTDGVSEGDDQSFLMYYVSQIVV